MRNGESVDGTIIEKALFNLQLATRNLQLSSSAFRVSSFEFQVSSCSVQCFNFQLSVFDMDFLYMTGSLFRELNANRLRRLLSILGVIIGTGAVISTLSVVEGGREQIRIHLEKLGINIVFLEDRYEPAAPVAEHPPETEPGGNTPLTGSGSEELAEKNALKNAVEETVMLGGFERSAALTRARTLSLEDIDFLRRRFPGAGRIEPQMIHWDRIGPIGGKPFGASIEGGTPEGARIRSLCLADGRYICGNDMEKAEKVCVLGAAMADKLFGRMPAVGQHISALGALWRVVGVLDLKGSMMRFDYDRLVIVPLTTLQERTGQDIINGVLIGARGTDEALRIHEQILDVVLPRLHDRKREVRIYDYADLNVPMLARMFDRRCKGYEAVGYTILLPASAVPGWPPEVPLPVEPEWKRDYAASVQRLIRDGVDPPLGNLFVHATRTLQPDAQGVDRARSATEAFLYRRLETLPETAGKFRLNAELPIPFDGRGCMEVDLLYPEACVAVELDGAQHLNPVAYRRDRHKDALLQENGYFVLRFLAADVGKHLDDVLDTIHRTLVHRTRISV